MDKPKSPPKELLPRISLFKYKPDQQLLDAALGKKTDKKSDRRANY